MALFFAHIPISPSQSTFYSLPFVRSKFFSINQKKPLFISFSFKYTVV